jgi:tRNA-specific 2-thiouridylase
MAYKTEMKFELWMNLWYPFRLKCFGKAKSYVTGETPSKNSLIERKKPASVVVALSGGVDSAVAAASLRIAGWEVYGLHFLLSDSLSKRDARTTIVKQVAEHLDIPLTTLDLRETFRQRVIVPFINAYLKGLTPNPCVVCNQVIKFEFLFDYARQHDIDYIVTGHYVRTRKRVKNGYFELLRGKDRHKDQSYFLHRLNPSFLSKTIFPLGECTKDDVRKKALEMKLPVQSVPESQEICFVPDNDYRLFIEKQRGSGVNAPGNIINDRGELLGQHMGAFRYTVGQRQGLGIASSRPYYVKEIRPEANEVVVGRKETLYLTRLETHGFSWLAEMPARRVMDVQAQIRYRHKPASGRFEVISSDKATFVFDEPQWAVTPGQALVCYEGERVLGGGWISGA